jgi:hypothetical protein
MKQTGASGTMRTAETPLQQLSRVMCWWIVRPKDSSQDARWIWVEDLARAP